MSSCGKTGPTMSKFAEIPKRKVKHHRLLFINKNGRLLFSIEVGNH
jgi:hypothetical protein